jgi:hypothetical protein
MRSACDSNAVEGPILNKIFQHPRGSSTKPQAYGDSLAIAQKLAAGDPGNTEWQRDLWISYRTVTDLAEREHKTREARKYWRQALDVLSAIDNRGLYLSPDERESLKTLRRKTGVDRG